jgi:hypothetical protein
MLNEQVLLLSKKHGQLKQAITKMVQVVMGFLDDAPSMEKKMQIIETLRTVTEGKVRASGGLQAKLNSADLRRSRARQSHKDPIEYQKGTRRYQGRGGHSLRIAG